MRRLLPFLIVLLAIAAWLAPVAPARADVPPGPPFPDPVSGQAVYDTAGLFTPATIAEAEATIDRIEERTGAEVVVYTQVNPDATADSTEEDARALIDEWGVGRKGFDDGLAIFMNVYTEPGGRVRGQVPALAAPGFAGLYLTNEERQQIYDEEMLPLLRDQRFDDALLVAMDRIDTAATGERATPLQFARQANAVIGIIGGPRRLPAPRRLRVLPLAALRARPVRAGQPVDLPARSAPGADGRRRRPAAGREESSRRTLTTALLDLASRDELAFRANNRLIGKDQVTVEIRVPDEADPRIGASTGATRSRRRKPTP